MHGYQQRLQYLLPGCLVFIPGFVAEVVARRLAWRPRAFSLPSCWYFLDEASEGAIAGMLTGIGFTASYIVYFKFIDPVNNVADAWWFGISPEGIGARHAAEFRGHAECQSFYGSATR